MDEVPHPIFLRFERWQGDSDPGFQRNWIGGRYRLHYVEAASPTNGVPPYPGPSEDVFEWVDLLEAVDGARERFVMVELGAGFGRWLVNGAIAARQRDLEFSLVGVEAEPTRFQWLREHLADNGVDPDSHRLEHAAVAARSGVALFQTGKTSRYYGHRLVTRARNLAFPLLGGRLRPVRTVGLAKLLEPFERVDFVDLDVEHAEADVLEAAASAIDEKAARVHVGTHSTAIEQRLRELFQALKWEPRFDAPIGQTVQTEFRAIEFENGVQSWINPRLDGTSLSSKRASAGSSAA